MLHKTDLIDLSKKQQQLDFYIFQTQRLIATPELRKKKLIAFFVELGEYANEERSFKYWSQKPPSSLARQLDEYVDGLHFLLSLGNDLNYDFRQYEFFPPNSRSLVDHYLVIFNLLSQLISLFETIDNPSLIHPVYAQLISAYCGIAQLTGYQNQDILAAYQQKNALNFNRQNNHY